MHVNHPFIKLEVCRATVIGKAVLVITVMAGYFFPRFFFDVSELIFSGDGVEFSAVYAGYGLWGGILNLSGSASAYSGANGLICGVAQAAIRLAEIIGTVLVLALPRMVSTGC